MIRRILKIPKKVEIEWSHPKKVEDVLNTKISDEESWGLYQISTKIENEVHFLYIGKSWNDYYARLRDHKRKWFKNYEGEKYVRFGSLLTRVTELQLGEIESTIIFKTNLPQNTQCTKSLTLNYDYVISSFDKRGAVPALIETDFY